MELFDELLFFDDEDDFPLLFEVEEEEGTTISFDETSKTGSIEVKLKSAAE